jgi:hypothetical protein
MTPLLFEVRRNRSADRRPDELTPPGLSFDPANFRHGLGRVIVGLELRPDEMERYLAIKAIRLADQHLMADPA